MFAITLPSRRVRFRRRSRWATVADVLHRSDVRRWNAVALVALAVLAVVYLALTNGNATAGYELRTLEGRAGELREEARRLDLQALAAQSLDALSARVADQGYVPVAEVRFVTPTDRAVARR